MASIVLSRCTIPDAPTGWKTPPPPHHSPFLLISALGFRSCIVDDGKFLGPSLSLETLLLSKVNSIMEL